MAPQREHDLPNGDRVIVVDTATASQHLAKVAQSFTDGNNEPLIFSNTGEPEAVVIPFSQWLAYLDLADQAAADDRIRDITSERLSSARREDYVPLEEFLGPEPPARGDSNDG
jgi:PHD/YefM family antitoxin component YafN of YafNO toxin-antitoxin module